MNARALLEPPPPAKALPLRGSRVVRNDGGDGVRRVVACVGCGGAVPWRGDGTAKALHAAGWGSRELGRLWFCPACFAPSALIVVPAYPIPAGLLAVASLSSAKRYARRRGRLEGQLEQLVHCDPPRARAYLTAILWSLGDDQARPWAELLARTEAGR